MRVFTFTYFEEESEDTLEEAIAALQKGTLKIDDLQGLSEMEGSGISGSFTVVDE